MPVTRNVIVSAATARSKVLALLNCVLVDYYSFFFNLHSLPPLQISNFVNIHLITSTEVVQSKSVPIKKRQKKRIKRV